jgi:hypothetical protein
VKTAPHFGHLTFVSFDTPVHPREKTVKIANAKRILITFFITLHLLTSDLSTSLLIFGHAFIHGEDGTAFWTFNLRVFCYSSAPK